MGLKGFSLSSTSWRAMGAGLIMLVGLAGCRGSSGDGDAVVVDGDTISMAQVQHYLTFKPTVKIEDQGREVRASVTQPLGFQAMDDLIRQTVLRHMAKDAGVYPTDADVAKELQFQEKRNPSFLRNAQVAGLSVDQIKDALSLSLAEENLLTKGITISPDEVNQFIKDNPDQFRQPATADLEWVVVTSETDKNLVDGDLLSGQPFVQVAEHYSKASNARAMQAKYPARNMNQFIPKLREMIDATPELKSTPWMKQGNLWAKWYIEKKTPAKDMPIDDTKREEVRRQLALQRGSAAMDLDKRIEDRIKNSKIDIKFEPYKNIWTQELATQSAAESATSPTPSGP